MKTKSLFKWIIAPACGLLMCVGVSAATYTTVYETNFQGWTENTSVDRVCVAMDNERQAKKRNIRVTPDLVNTGITNNTDLPTADMNGSIGRGGGTNYLQLPAMALTNSVRVTFYMAQPSGSNSGFDVRYNQEGITNCTSGDYTINNSTLILNGTISGSDRTVNKFQNTVTITSGSYNILLFNTGGSSGDAVRLMYLKIETEAPATCSNPAITAPTLTVEEGSTLTDLSADISGGTWSVTNGTGSADIDEDTGELTGISAGTVTVVYTVADGCYDEIEITVTPTTNPVIIVSPETVDFGELTAGSGQQFATFTVSGTNLTADIALALSGAGLSLSQSSVTQTAGTAAETTIFVFYTPTAAGTITGTINATSAGAVPKIVNITGSVKEVLSASASGVTCSDATLSWNAISDATGYTVKLCAEGGAPVETLQATYATTEYARANNGVSTVTGATNVNLDPANGPYIFEFEFRTDANYTGYAAIRPVKASKGSTNNGFRIGGGTTADLIDLAFTVENLTAGTVEILTNPSYTRGDEYQLYRFKLTGAINWGGGTAVGDTDASSIIEVRNENSGVGTFYVRNVKIYKFAPGIACEEGIVSGTTIDLADKFGDFLDPETEYTYTVTPTGSAASAFTDTFTTIKCSGRILTSFTVKWTDGEFDAEAGTITVGDVATTGSLTKLETYFTLATGYDDHTVWLDGTPLVLDTEDQQDPPVLCAYYNYAGLPLGFTGTVDVKDSNGGLVETYILTIAGSHLSGTGLGNTPAEIVSTEYYTLTGIKLAKQPLGVSIKKTIDANGTVSVSKVITK